MKVQLTRAEIAESLRPRPGQRPDELARLTFDGLEDILRGIVAEEFPRGHAIGEVAAAMGFLLAGCIEQAARAARQAVTPHALPAASQPASAADLLAGVVRLRSLNRDKVRR